MFRKIKPGRLLVLGYGAVILAGAFLLMLPWASTSPGSASFLQAWFTATSAFTVTGLTVVDTSTYWTVFGQTVILFLMQMGGLGLMVLTTVLLITLGFRVRLSQRVLAAQDRNHFTFTDILRLVKSVVLLTLALEGAGAVLMGLALPDVWDNGTLRGLFFLVFHSVSAFNGAGFDLTGHSLEPYRFNLPFNLVVIALILMGSLGYVVLQELFLIRRWRRLTLHSKLVLWVTGAITLFGGAFYFLTEYSASLAAHGFAGKLVESFFQVTIRTAGFVTVPVSAWSEPFIFLTIMMMFVGASPGSVGGGIKTTTAGTIVLAVWAIAQGKKDVTVSEREIDPQLVEKAFSVAVIALLLVSASTLIIMVVEQLPFMPVLFEVVSAMATVGLSMGVTQKMSAFGQVLLTVIMFVGRIGVLSLVFFLAKKGYKNIRYMKEDILIG